MINISEGRNASTLAQLAQSAAKSLLDVHSDPFHNRSVFTLSGMNVYQDALALTTRAFDLLDLRQHSGVHPRIGVVDVVPFVPLGDTPMSEAARKSETFAKEISTRFLVPVFLYGKARTLPEIRREAFKSLAPDYGPSEPHPRFGAVAVGARPILVAYNLYLEEQSISGAKEIAARIRCNYFRTLGLATGDRIQVSGNLIDPLNHGIYEFYTSVTKYSSISQGELVGLAPLQVILETPKELWPKLGLSVEKALENRIAN